MGSRTRIAELVAATLLIVAFPCRAAELRGRVDLVDGAGRSGAADPREAVVWFDSDGADGSRAAPQHVEIGTRNKDFEPRVAIVPVGSTVAFPNRDPILHNVFSVSPDNAFDLGLYGPDETRAARFDHPGIVRVFCNVHHSMAAYVVVLDTVHHTRPRADGTFVLDGVPLGAGTLTVWHERAEPWTARIDGSGGAAIEARVPITRRRVPQHLDKDGRPYRARDRERYD